MAEVKPSIEMQSKGSRSSVVGKGLSWSNIRFEVPGRKILKGVSGNSSSFTAIMGPSGAGKSTLMNILAGRLQGGGKNVVEGDVFYNGRKVNPTTFASNIAYVMQEDAIKATTTPREAFHFSAALRLGDSVTEEERHKRVEDLIVELRLQKCADTMVGDARLRIPGISGGERKRTAIGVELISNPAIVFLDEPTSGLDSFAAHRVVTVLNRLAQKGRTVLCTIHQPSSEVFSVFDDVLLIADGRLVYHDKRTSMNAYFESLGHKCPPSYNPADFVMFLMQESSDKEIKNMCDTWGSRESKCLRIEDVEGGDSKKASKTSISSKTSEADEVENLKMSNVMNSGPMASWSTQLFWLSRREFRSVIRNKGALIAQFCAVTFMYVIIGNIFYQAAEYHDVDGSMESVVFVTTRHFGLITFIAIGSMFGLAQENMLNFPVERPIFLREYAGGTYNAAPYFFSKLMIETPRAFIVVVLIYLITYWMVGFNGSFVVMAGITTLFGLVAASVTLIIGAMVTNVQVGVQLTPLVFVPQLLFAGFYIPIDDIPVYMRWAQYLCSLKYAVNLLLIEEMKDVPDTWPSAYNTSMYTRAVFGCGEIDSNYNCIGDRDIVGIPGTSDTTDFGLFPRTDVFYDQRFIYVGILLGIFVAFRLGSLAILVHKAKNF